MIDLEEIQKAISFSQAGKFDEAEKIYNDLILKEPDNPTLLSVMGLFYVEKRDFDKASELLEKAYQKQKTYGIISALGFAEYEKRNYEKASRVFEEALEYGSSPDVYTKLISSLYIQRKLKKAIEYADIMYEKYPDNISAVANRVKALSHSGKLKEAEEFCVGYLKEHQDSAPMWHQLGYLKELIYCDDNQARECYKQALNLGLKEVIYDIAVASDKLGEKAEAEKYYKQMLESFPNDVNTYTSLGMLYLSQKRFDEGYRYFYKRNSRCLSKTDNLWKLGDKIEDNLVIIGDQGFGDQIQFVRYIPFLGERSIKIAVSEPLRRLFEHNYPNLEFIEYNDIPRSVQAIRLTDIAYALNMNFDKIPLAEGYLNADLKDVKSDKLKVGFCWEAGSAGIRGMLNRTIHVRCFEPLFNLDSVQPYSFQFEDTFKGNQLYADKMINLAKDFKDFYDTACAIKAMDVVITVDTAVAHLAGALGVKTFMLLPYSADWRWFSDTKTTPWYKSVTIFKQTIPISWEEPFREVISELIQK